MRSSTRAGMVLMLAVVLGAGCAGVGETRTSADPWLTSDFYRTATPETIAAALEAGAEIDARDEDGWTPLHYAARAVAAPEIISALVEAGADVNARTDDEGFTPLLIAVFVSDESGAVETLSALIAVSADVNAADDIGTTALHYAALVDAPVPVIVALAEAGADVNAKDDYGGTPIYSVESPEMVRALVEWGADVNMPVGPGATPLFIVAERDPSSPTVEALREAGAKCPDGFRFTGGKCQ